MEGHGIGEVGSGRFAVGCEGIEDTALDALDEVEAAVSEDIGGFARPGRCGARSRADGYFVGRPWR